MLIRLLIPWMVLILLRALFRILFLSPTLNLLFWPRISALLFVARISNKCPGYKCCGLLTVL